VNELLLGFGTIVAMDAAQIVKVVVIAIFVVAAAVVAGLLDSRHETQRRKEVELAAAAGGWELQGYSVAARKFYELRGNVGATSNAISRPDGFCALFDYKFVRRPMGSSRWRYDVLQTVAYVRSERLDLPVMSIEPRKIWSPADRDRLIGKIEFSDAYSVRTREPADLDELVNPETRKYLMDNPGIMVNGAGNEIFFFRAGTIAPPDQIGAFMSWGESLARMFERR
jgi:hypothetical protein